MTNLRQRAQRLSRPAGSALAAMVAGAFLFTSAPAQELSAKENEAARKIYVAKCAKCHKFYDPNKYSDEEWRVWMAKMSRKAKLKPEQERLLSKYINENLRHPAVAKKGNDDPK